MIRSVFIIIDCWPIGSQCFRVWYCRSTRSGRRCRTPWWRGRVESRERGALALVDGQLVSGVLVVRAGTQSRLDGGLLGDTGGQQRADCEAVTAATALRSEAAGVVFRAGAATALAFLVARSALEVSGEVTAVRARSRQCCRKSSRRDRAESSARARRVGCEWIGCESCCDERSETRGANRKRRTETKWRECNVPNERGGARGGTEQVIFCLGAFRRGRIAAAACSSFLSVSDVAAVAWHPPRMIYPLRGFVLAPRGTIVVGIDSLLAPCPTDYEHV
jgi:hypothetical protein